MVTLLFILLWLLVAVLVILAGVLLTPVRFWVRLETAPVPKFQVQTSLFGGLTPRMSIIDSTRPRKKAGKKRAKKKENKKASKRRWNIGENLGVMSEIPHFLSGILNAFHFDYLRVNADFGLADPADTGYLFGCLTPFIYSMPPSSRISVALRPDFGKERFDGALEAAIHITPAALLAPVIKLAWRVYGPKK